MLPPPTLAGVRLHRPDHGPVPGQDGFNWIAQGVHQSMDLGAETASASPDRLIAVDLSGARAVLMCPHHGAVDHRIFIVGILG